MAFLVTQTYLLTLDQRAAISHSFGETGPANYVVIEQFLRDVVAAVLNDLVKEMKKAQKTPTSGMRVRKRPRRPPADDGEGA